MPALKAKVTSIGQPRFSRNGDVFFQRIKLQLEDGSFAMTDLVSSYRNFQWWAPVIKSGPGTVIGGVFLKEGYTKPLKVNADSQVFITQDVLFNTQKEELKFQQTTNVPDHGVESYNFRSSKKDREYKVTFDAGDVVMQKVIPIEPDDFVWDLRKKCFELFEPALREFFANPAELINNALQQDQACMTYAQKRIPEDSQLNLNVPAHHLYNLFRACDPREYPAFVVMGGKKHIVTNVTPGGQVTFLKEQADISVIVPCWNYGMFLTECLDSILAQTVLPREIIIADDCSTDKSPAIIEEYRKAYPFLIRVMRNEARLGTVPNENVAAKTVTTKYFFFLDADDKIDPGYIEKCMARATDDKVAIIYSDMVKFGNWDGEWRVQDWDPAALRQGNYINGHSVILKQAFDEIGGLKDGPGFEDHQMWVDIIDLDKGYYGVHIPELLIWYRRHDYGHRTDRSDISRRSNL